MDCLYAAYQYEIIGLKHPYHRASPVEGILTNSTKFHAGVHEGSFFKIFGKIPLTAQHTEHELSYSAVNAAQHTNFNNATMVDQQQNWRNISLTINEDARLFNGSGLRPGYANPTAMFGPVPLIKKSQNDVHAVKSRLSDRKSLIVQTHEFSGRTTGTNADLHSKLALKFKYSQWTYEDETDAELPHGRVYIHRRIRIKNVFVKRGTIVQVFDDDEPVYGQVLSILQVVPDVGTPKEEAPYGCKLATAPFFLHLQWFEALNPLIDSPNNSQDRHTFNMLFPRDSRPYYTSEFNNMPRNVIEPFLLLRDVSKWRNSDVVCAEDMKRVVYMHTLPNFDMPPPPKDHAIAGRLFFLNTVVSLPWEVYTKRIMEDPYVRHILATDYSAKGYVRQ
jgi:hypothetical protein